MGRFYSWLGTVKKKLFSLVTGVKKQTDDTHSPKLLEKSKSKPSIIYLPASLKRKEKVPFQILQRYEDSIYWEDVELIHGNQIDLKQEKFIEIVEHKDSEIIRYFQSTTPSSQFFLLHHLPPEKNAGRKKTPVLLVHGASHQANLSWCKSFKEEPGLLYFLNQIGYDVYAITFAHSHGDNLMQAIQVSNAIQRVCDRTGAEKVDLIAHSKGGMPTRLYVSDFCMSLNAPYQNNVRKYIMLGTPNRGIDFVFRNITANYGVIRMEINAPVACDSLLYYGTYLDTTDRSLYADGGAFPGQSQLLYRWDDKYPPPPETRTLYYGGQNMYYHSRGIDIALQEGDRLIEKMIDTPVHPSIQLYALAGSHAFFDGIPGEKSGKSDGLVLVESVLDLESMATHPHQIKRRDEMALNHLDLLYHEQAHQWVQSALEED